MLFQKLHLNKKKERNKMVAFTLTHTHTHNIPLFDEWHCRPRGKQVQFANSPALTVNALLWQFDGWETLARESLQGGKHGTSHESLAVLRLVNKRIILSRESEEHYWRNTDRRCNKKKKRIQQVQWKFALGCYHHFRSCLSPWLTWEIQGPPWCHRREIWTIYLAARPPNI